MASNQISPKIVKRQTQYKNPSEQMRIVRGYAILSKGDTPTQISKETYQVPSQQGNGIYTITKKGRWECTCPDFETRQMECKHIHAVTLYLALKEKVRRDALPHNVKEKPKCHYCQSHDVVKNGKRYGDDRIKQTYRCNQCRRRFIEEKDFERMKGDAKVTTLMLDLYFKGISLRKISDHLKQFYDIQINASNVLRRIHKYSTIINDYTQTLQPELSERWHTDEMKIQAGGKWKWLWNVMDSETKYLITRMVSDNRRIFDSKKVLARAKEHAGTDPVFLVTDGCVSYARSIKAVFPSTQHIKLKSIRDKRVNNNNIERLNGTVRERLKVMRGMHSRKSAELMTQAYANYYNHIKIHQSLGVTPAMKAGIKGTTEGNRWATLIKNV